MSHEPIYSWPRISDIASMLAMGWHETMWHPSVSCHVLWCQSHAKSDSYSKGLKLYPHLTMGACRLRARIFISVMGAKDTDHLYACQTLPWETREGISVCLCIYRTSLSILGLLESEPSFWRFPLDLNPILPGFQGDLKLELSMIQAPTQSKLVQANKLITNWMQFW